VAFLRDLAKEVRSIPLNLGKSRWTAYQQDLDRFTRPEAYDAKQRAVAQVLDQLRPTTVVDIGCNRGGYAIMAAQVGARVTAFDSDEDSVGLLFLHARARNMAILPLVMDVLNPSPACGWLGIQYAAAAQRFKSELALALALIHHLAITQRQTFQRIVPALSAYAGKWLLTEFVPLDDPRSRELLTTNRRDLSWYTLDEFQRALSQEFNRIEVLPSNQEGRTLILCTR
jgi:hypothetical protein